MVQWLSIIGSEPIDDSSNLSGAVDTKLFILPLYIGIDNNDSHNLY